jgi:hypothetical protein
VYKRGKYQGIKQWGVEEGEKPLLMGDLKCDSEERHQPLFTKTFPLPLFKGEGGLRGMGFI